MANLEMNIRQANADFVAIKEKIVEKGVEVANGTRTADYAQKVEEVYEAGKDVINNEVELVNSELEEILYGTDTGGKSWYDAFWDAYQENGTRTSYIEAFAGNCWTQELLERMIKYPIKFIAEVQSYTCHTKGLFRYLNWGGKSPIDMTNILLKFDFTDCQRMISTFQNAYVKNITLDLSNCDSIEQIFNCGDAGGKTCENVTLKVSAKCKKYTSSFYYCSGLTEIRFMDGSEIAADISFQQSTKLSKASIESIINALSTTTTGLTVTLSQTAVNNAFTAEEWATLKATKNNWEISLI